MGRRPSKKQARRTKKETQRKGEKKKQARYSLSTNKHHRKPKSTGGGNGKGNISQVPLDKHRAYHLLFGTKTPYEIADILNQTWIDPSKLFIVVDREES